MWTKKGRELAHVQADLQKLTKSHNPKDASTSKAVLIVIKTKIF